MALSSSNLDISSPHVPQSDGGAWVGVAIGIAWEGATGAGLEKVACAGLRGIVGTVMVARQVGHLKVRPACSLLIAKVRRHDVQENVICETWEAVGLADEGLKNNPLTFSARAI